MGLFSCVGGPAQHAPSKKQLIVDLERKRENLQKEVAKALAKAQAHEQEAATFASERNSWAMLRAEYEAALQAKTAHTARLLSKCNNLLEGETDMAKQVEVDKTFNVAVTAFEPDKDPDQLQLHALEAEPKQAGTLAEDAAASPEDLLDAAVGKLLASRGRLVQRVDQLAVQVEEIRADYKAKQMQMQGQHAVLEQRCVALENENQALGGLNVQLQSQVERISKEHAVLQASSQDTALKLQTELQAKQLDCTDAAAELQSARVQLQCLQQELEDRTRQMGELQARQAVEMSEVQAMGASRDSELQALATGRSEAVAALGTARRQVDSLRRSLEASRQEALALGDAQAASMASLDDAQQQLSATRRQLSDTEARTASMQERARLAEGSVAVLEVQLQSTRAALVEAQQQVSQKTAEVSTMLRALHEAQEHAAESEKGMAAAKAVAEASERSLQDMTAQYVAAKRDLIASSKQMAAVAQEHNCTMGKLTSSSSQLTAMEKEVQDLEARVQALQQGAAASTQRLRELEAQCPVLESELSDLRSVHGMAQQDLERLQALLRGISRLSAKAGGLVPGQGQDLDPASLAAFYETTVKEDCLRLKLCDMPLALCGPLFNAVADSRQLSSLVLDMDSSREPVWEKAGLRVGCLAAALGVNSSLRSVELTGWTWSELGNGCALPFLTLGSSSGLTNLCTVKVDTKLFDVDCAAVLMELLQCGLVQLKRPGGQGVLRLYSDNEDLDEWYGMMIQDAVEPTWQRQSPSGGKTQAQAQNLPSSTPAPAVALNQSVAMSVASTAVYGNSALHGGGGMASPAGRAVYSAATYAASACVTPPPHAAVSGLTASSLALLTPGRATPDGRVLPNDMSEALTDLSNKSLDSHHMVVVMAVLLCCPHLKRLRLDGNKIGNAGAELLSLGLMHNSALRELLLSRNSITAPGAKRLARSLEKNMTLRRLDLSAQRFEGLGAAGAESLVASLRHNTALEELSLSSNSLGSAAAAPLCAALRLAGPGSALKRLGLGHNGFDSGAAKTLQEVAAEHNMVVTV